MLQNIHDKVVAPRLLCCGLYLLHGGIGLTEADIVGNRVREQIDPLEHEGEVAYQTVVAVFPHIPSAKAHAAGLTFIVEDSGSGFTKEALLHGTEQFFMDDTSRNIFPEWSGNKLNRPQLSYVKEILHSLY